MLSSKKDMRNKLGWNYKMGTFVLHAFPSANNLNGTDLTKKADEVILMGALVKKGTAAGDIKETSSSTDVVMGVSKYDEQVAFTNLADQYSDNGVVVMETLVNGAVLNLLNSGTDSIAEGVQVEAAADGKIATGNTDPIGITNEVIAGSSRGEVIIQLK